MSDQKTREEDNGMTVDANGMHVVASTELHSDLGWIRDCSNQCHAKSCAVWGLKNS